MRPSYLSNGNPILVRRHLYIATAPWTLLFKSFISSIDILRFSSEIAHICMPQDLWWPVNTIDPVLWQHTASQGHIGPTHWGRVTHICVGKLTIIGSDNGLSPGRRQAKIWTNAEILLIGPLGTNFSEILIALFHSRNCIWKYRLRNGVHFVSASMCWGTCCILLTVRHNNTTEPPTHLHQWGPFKTSYLEIPQSIKPATLDVKTLISRWLLDSCSIETYAKFQSDLKNVNRVLVFSWLHENLRYTTLTRSPGSDPNTQALSLHCLPAFAS